MKTFIAATVTLSLFLAACTPAVLTGVETSQPSLRSQDGTFSSEYIPGSTPSASFEVFISAKELSGNGVRFSAVTLSELNSLSGPFAYISRKYDNGTTIYTMDVFTNYHVAEYEATQVETLNLFLIQGADHQAKKNMAQWCRAQGPQTKEEGLAGTN